MGVVLALISIAAGVIPVHGLYFIYFFHIYLFPQARRTKPISRLLSPPYWKSKYSHSDKENRKDSLQVTVEPKNSHYQEAKVHITAKIRAKLYLFINSHKKND